MNSNQLQIHVVIKNKQQILFNDFAHAVSSFNEQGVFDILPMHENFISIIKDFLIIHKTTGEKHQLQISSALLKAHENSIYIYLGLDNQAHSPTN